jgi:hypothetical protein
MRSLTTAITGYDAFLTSGSVLTVVAAKVSPCESDGPRVVALASARRRIVIGDAPGPVLAAID